MKKFFNFLAIVLLFFTMSCDKSDYIEETKESSLREISIRNDVENFFEQDTMFLKIHGLFVQNFGEHYKDSLDQIDTVTFDFIFNDFKVIAMDFLEDSLQVDPAIFVLNNNITNIELVSFGFHYYLTQNYGSQLGLRGDWVSCLSAALGVRAVRELGLSGVMSAQGAVQIIKAVGKRYLGYIGLAIMVHDFIDCMS